MLILNSLTGVLEGVEGRSQQRKELQDTLTHRFVASLLVSTLERTGTDPQYMSGKIMLGAFGTT